MTCNKVLIIFDKPQIEIDKKSKEEKPSSQLTYLRQQLGFAGAESKDVTIWTLADDDSGKASSYKAKEELTKELIETFAPNLLVFATAKAFELCMGIKGASVYYGKVVMCEKYNTKAITMPSVSMLYYNPSMREVLERCIQLVVSEKDFPEIVNKPDEEKQANKNYVLVKTIGQFRKFLEHYKNNVDRFAIDLETDSLQFNNGNILTIQFSHKYGFGYCVPTANYGGEWTTEEWEEVKAGIKELVEDETKQKIGANIYFDFKFLSHAYGYKLPKNNVFDVLIASFLCDENRESHSLKYCAATLLNGAADYEAPLEEFKTKYCKENKIKKGDFKYSFIPVDILFPYACMDVDYSLQLADVFVPLLEKEEQVEVFKDVSSYAWALAKIEMTGWQVDLEEAARYKADLEERIEGLAASIHGLPDVVRATEILSVTKLATENAKRKNKLKELKEPLTFSTGSVLHKRVLFRDVMKLPQIKKTKKGEYATDKECFDEWFAKYPDKVVLKTIKELEQLNKMLGTYVNTILTRSVNGRIHCSYRVCGTATGRVSAASPNLQNVPAHSDEAQRLKKCFIAASGCSVLISDLSNAELRLAAALSKDPVLSKGFREGLDPHSNTAKNVFNLDCEVHEVKEKYNEKRQLAKILSFASLYGAAPSLIAKKAGITVEEAANMLSEYFTKHKGIKKLLADNEAFTKKHGYSLAISGRKRRVGAEAGRGIKDYEAARSIRQVNNFIVQSVASDGMLQSIVAMWEEIEEKKLPYKIINVIHDSCEMEVPDECIEAAHEFIIRHLSKFPKWIKDVDFPMLADAEAGKTWADVKELETTGFEEELEEELEEAA